MSMTRRLREALDDPSHWERDLVYGDTRWILRRMFTPTDVVVFIEKNADGTRTQHTKPIEHEKREFSCWDPEGWFWK